MAYYSYLSAVSTPTEQAYKTYPPASFLFQSERMSVVTEPIQTPTNIKARQACPLSTTKTTSKSTPSKSTSSPTPTVTPVGGNGGVYSINVYSDLACKNLVAGYLGQDLYHKCVKFPSAILSYRFASQSDFCGSVNGGYQEAVILSNDDCNQQDFVGGGCGDDQTCQQIYSDPPNELGPGLSIEGLMAVGGHRQIQPSQISNGTTTSATQ